MLNVLAQSTYTYESTEVSSGFAIVYFIGVILLAIVAIAGMWKTYEKAGQPGWASIIPIYNVWVLLKVAGRPEWWILLYFIPFVNIVVSLLVALDVGKRFGKSDVFSVFLLWLFSAIGYIIIGFGDDTYSKSA